MKKRAWACLIALGCIGLSACRHGSNGLPPSSTVLTSNAFEWNQSSEVRSALWLQNRGPVGKVEPEYITRQERAAGRLLKLSKDGFRSMVYLSHASLFATYPRIGYRSRFPPQVVAFQRLLREPDANEAFHYLVEQPSPVAALYGLCGLYFTDRDGFRVEAKRLDVSTIPVFTMRGETGRFIPMSELIFNDLANPHRRQDPSAPRDPSYQGRRDRMAGWSCDETNSVLDIVGGGYPLFLRDAKPIPEDGSETTSGGRISQAVRASL